MSIDWYKEVTTPEQQQEALAELQVAASYYDGGADDYSFTLTRVQWEYLYMLACKADEIERLQAVEREVQGLAVAAHNFMTDTCYDCAEGWPCAKPFHKALRDAITAIAAEKTEG